MQAAWRNIIVIVIALVALVFIAAPSAFAVIGIDEPIIPCGTEIITDASGTHIVNPCTFCHFFALIQNIYNFLIFIIVPPVAVLMVAIGGFYWLTAGGSMSRVQKGWGVLKTVGIGLLMVYVSWLVVSFGINLIARKLGTTYNPAKWYNPSSWFKIACDYNGSAYQCPNTGEIFASEIECNKECPQKCTPVRDNANGVYINVDPATVGENTATVLSWRIDRDIKGNPIDPKSCSATATSGAFTSGTAVTSSFLTEKIHSTPSGSLILDKFDHPGSYTFDITCGSDYGAARLNVQECSANDLSLHWTDAQGHEVDTINVSQTAYATMDYDVPKCSGQRAIVDIINETDSNHTVDTKSVAALDKSGRFKVPYQAKMENCPNGRGADGDVLTFRATIQVQNGATLDKVDGDLHINCN